MTALTAVVDLLRAKVGAVVQKEGKKAITAGAANITTNTDNDNNGGMAGVETIVNPVPWNWVASQLFKVAQEYPAGVTEGILLAELDSQWHETSSELKRSGLMRRFETIDSIYDGKMISSESIFNLSINAVKTLPGTSRTIILSLSDGESRKTIDMYLHQRFYCLMDMPVYKSLFVDNNNNSNSNTPRSIYLTSVRFVTTAQTARLLPTEAMIIQLNESSPTDCGFLQKEFSNDRLEDLFKPYRQPTQQSQSQARSDYKLLVKIMHINPPEPARAYRRFRKQTILVNDLSISQNVCFTLWDDQVHLAALLKKGDMLALYRPYVNTDFANKVHVNSASVKDNNNNIADDSDTSGLFLEYGSCTVLFVIPQSTSAVTKMDASQLPLSTQDITTNQLRDDEGVFDYRTCFLNRTRISDILPQSIHFSVLGRIIALSGNMPHFNENGKRQDRYCLRVQDETGTVDITLWESLGRATASFDLGQLVYLENLKITDKKKEDGVCYVVGMREMDTKVFNLSTMKGLLSSSCLRRVGSIYDMKLVDLVDDDKALESNFVIKGVITHWAFMTSDIIVPVHSQCLRPLQCSSDDDDDDGTFVGSSMKHYNCPFCYATVSVASYQINASHDMRNAVSGMCLLIDDGTESVMVQVGAKALDEVLPVSSLESIINSPTGRKNERLSRLVDSALLGREFVVLVSGFMDSDGCLRFRVDGLADCHDVVPTTKVQ